MSCITGRSDRHTSSVPETKYQLQSASLGAQSARLSGGEKTDTQLLTQAPIIHHIVLRKDANPWKTNNLELQNAVQNQFIFQELHE